MALVRAKVSEKIMLSDPLSICGVIESSFLCVLGGRCHPLEPNLGTPTYLFPRPQPASFVILPFFDTCSVSHGRNPMWKEAKGF